MSLMLPLPILLIALFSGSLFAAYLYFGKQAAGRRSTDWHALVARLQPLPGHGLDSIANAFLHPKQNQIELEPEIIYELLGGLDGLRIMGQNAAVMIELAGYASRWNEVEAVVVTEMIRRDARRLQHVLRMIRLEMLWQSFSTRTPFRLQEAAAAYHLMSSRLTALYESTHVGLYPRLAASL